MRTGSMTKYGLAFILSGISIGLMRIGARVLDDAARRAASTFEIPTGGMLLHAVLFLLAGAALAVILMIRAKRDQRYGYLVAAAVIRILILSVPFLILWNLLQVQISSVSWMIAPEVRAGTALAVGALLAHILWRATGPETMEEPS